MNKAALEDAKYLKELKSLFKNEHLSGIFLVGKALLFIIAITILASLILKLISFINPSIKILDMLSILFRIIFGVFGLISSYKSLTFLIDINCCSYNDFYMTIIKYAAMLVFNCFLVFGMILFRDIIATNTNSIKTSIERYIYCLIFIYSYGIICLYPSIYTSYGYDLVRLLFNIYSISIISSSFYFIIKEILNFKRYLKSFKNE